MRQIPLDLRFALRRIRQQPGFAAAVVLTLAVGLGANTAVFTLVHALVLRTLPVERPHELYRLGNGTDCCVNSDLPVSFSLFSFRLFEHLRANAQDFTELAGFQANTTPFGVRRTGQSVSTTAPGAFVTGNYFTMFGVRPAAGRVFTSGDDRPGAPAVAVISHDAWTRFFGQDPTLVGADVFVNGQAFTIVGVAAPRFFGDTVRPDPAAIWIPIAQEPRIRGAGSLLDRADQHWLYAIGRIRRGAHPAQAGAAMTAALQQWLRAQPFVDDRERAGISKHGITVVPAAGGVALARAQYARSLTILFAASAMVLLIAIANLANLLLARADRGQAAISVALGASRRRLIQQSLVEGVLLALAGGAVGVAVAALGTRVLIAWVFPIVSFVPVESAPNPSILLFAFSLSVLAGMLFTAVPAWMMARTRPLDALTGLARSVSEKSLVPRGSLLVVQVALSLALLTSASLLGKSLSNLEQQPLGFVPTDRTVFHVDPPSIAGDIDRLTTLFSRIEEALRRLPGVERVAYSMYSPMDGNNWSSEISIQGRGRDPQQPDASSWNRVSTGFFETVGTRVVRGRGFDGRDTPRGRRVAVVNEAFVKRFFDKADPIGQSLGIGDASHAGDFEIVGVVDNVKFSGARQRDVRPMLFLPSFQTVEYSDPTRRSIQARSTLPRTIIVQAAPAARDIEAGVRRVLAEVEPNLNVVRVLPMTLQVNGNFRIERLLARLVTTYGGLALGVALLGLYGVTAYGVSQRRREIGLRMALGASSWGVVRTCVRGPMVHTAIGLALGTAASVVVRRAIGSQLYGVEGFDLGAFAAAVLPLMASAIVAAALPARSAASLNPAAVLRGE